jgi:hypothetical protein
VALLAGVVLLAGCGPPPQVAPTPEGPLPGPVVPSPTTAAPPPPSPGTTTTAAGQDVAVDCAGQPGADQVVAVLRAARLLPDGAQATVIEGPLCAGTWQYAVVSVPDRDPLQVITSGPPDALTLVTAGTEVCTVQVRVNAPPGIRAAASCVG